MLECEADGYRGPEATPRVRSFKNIQWGDEHGLILDKFGRLWGTGRTNFGLLGLSEEETDEIVNNPRQITYNLPTCTTN